MKDMDISKPLVHILILNFNSYIETVNCLEALLNNIRYPNYRIIVLDNNSTDESIISLPTKVDEWAKLYGQKISFIENHSNYGYAHGNNRGIEIAIKENSDFICIINPDVIVEEDFLDELVYQMKSDPSIGMIAPAIVNSEAKDTCIIGGAQIGYISGYTKMINAGNKLDGINPKVYACDYIGGMCLLVRRRVINEIGLIPENYFLFYEETEWCNRCIRAGYRCVVDVGTKVIHKGSVTIDRESNESSIRNKGINMKEYYLFRNRVIYQKRKLPRLFFGFFIIYYYIEILYGIIRRRWGRMALIALGDGIREYDRLGYVIRC